MHESAKTYPPTNGRPVTFVEDPPKQRKVSPRLGRRSSADTDLSVKYSSSPRLARTQSDGNSIAPSPDDGLLHPPPVGPSRRNTTGGLLAGSLSRHAPGVAQQPSHDTMDVGAEFGELASDIQLQAEQIRKERLTKRAKAAQEAENLKAEQQEGHKLTRTTSLVRALSNREEKPLVGSLIGEGHANYVLMFNMLTGIRVAVSRCQAKIRRPLTEEDFKAAHKYSFDL